MSISSQIHPRDNEVIIVKTTSGNTQITVGALKSLINAAGYNTAVLINNYGGNEYALIWFQTVAEDLYLADDQTFIGWTRNYPILGIKPNSGSAVYTTYRLKNDLSGFETFQDVSWDIGRSKQIDGIYYTIVDDNARSTESFPAMCISSYNGHIYCNGEPYVAPSFSGGAGSGYIGNPLLTNKKMVGYNVPTSSAESTKTESVNEASETPVSGKPKIGNGFARIKFLGEPQYDTWIDGKRIYVEELNLSNPQLFQEVSVPITNLDIDTVISISGTYNSLKSTYGNYWYKFPYYQDDNHRSFMRLESENGNYVRLVYRINLGNNEGNSTSKQIFRILYTKKTEV